MTMFIAMTCHKSFSCYFCCLTYCNLLCCLFCPAFVSESSGLSEVLLACHPGDDVRPTGQTSGEAVSGVLKGHIILLYNMYFAARFRNCYWTNVRYIMIYNVWCIESHVLNMGGKGTLVPPNIAKPFTRDPCSTLRQSVMLADVACETPLHFQAGNRCVTWKNMNNHPSSWYISIIVIITIIIIIIMTLIQTAPVVGTANFRIVTLTRATSGMNGSCDRMPGILGEWHHDPTAICMSPLFFIFQKAGFPPEGIVKKGIKAMSVFPSFQDFQVEMTYDD